MQKHALGVLFTGISAALLLTAVAAFTGSGGGAARFVVALAALALAAWMATLALSAFRRRRGG